MEGWFDEVTSCAGGLKRRIGGVACGNARRACMNERAFRRAIRVLVVGRFIPPTLRMRKTPKPRLGDWSLGPHWAGDRLHGLRLGYPGPLTHSRTHAGRCEARDTLAQDLTSGPRRPRGGGWRREERTGLAGPQRRRGARRTPNLETLSYQSPQTLLICQIQRHTWQRGSARLMHVHDRVSGPGTEFASCHSRPRTNRGLGYLVPNHGLGVFRILRAAYEPCDANSLNGPAKSESVHARATGVTATHSQKPTYPPTR